MRMGGSLSCEQTRPYDARLHLDQRKDEWHNEHVYLRYFLQKLPMAETAEEIEALLPHVLDPVKLSIMSDSALSSDVVTAAA